MNRSLLLLAVITSLVACGKKKQTPAASQSGSSALSSGSSAVSGAGSSAAPASGGSAAPASPPAASGAPVSIGGAAQNSAQTALESPCNQSANKVKGNQGTSWFMHCPAGCTEAGSVWGSDIYTDDSKICIAAIHAGAITANDGGAFLVTWAPGQPTYIGSERNGVTTDDYHAWSRSFFVQKIDAAGNPTTAAPALVTAPNTAHLSCRMNADPLGGNEGTKWSVDCPAGCSGGNVWGSDTYTADSVVCTAAIHAGVIDAKGGSLVVTIRGKQDKMTGSTRNGVTTQDYGAYGRTFTVAKP